MAPRFKYILLIPIVVLVVLWGSRTGLHWRGTGLVFGDVFSMNPYSGWNSFINKYSNARQEPVSIDALSICGVSSSFELTESRVDPSKIISNLKANKEGAVAAECGDNLAVSTYQEGDDLVALFGLKGNGQPAGIAGKLQLGKKAFVEILNRISEGQLDKTWLGDDIYLPSGLEEPFSMGYRIGDAKVSFVSGTIKRQVSKTRTDYIREMQAQGWEYLDFIRFPDENIVFRKGNSECYVFLSSDDQFEPEIAIAYIQRKE